MNDLIAEASRLSHKIDEGVRHLSKSARQAAEAEQAYRQAKGEEWTRVKAEGDRTAEHMKAEVDARTAGERFARDLAEGESKAALEALRSRRQQLSSLQSLLSAQKADQEFHTYQGGGQ